VVAEPVPVLRGRPSLRGPRKKAAPAKPAAKPKPEPWMLPPLRPWTHVYKHAAAGVQPKGCRHAKQADLLQRVACALTNISFAFCCCSGGPASCEAAQGPAGNRGTTAATAARAKRSRRDACTPRHGSGRRGTWCHCCGGAAPWQHCQPRPDGSGGGGAPGRRPPQRLCMGGGQQPPRPVGARVKVLC
jgi:hypothetical protein